MFFSSRIVAAGILVALVLACDPPKKDVADAKATDDPQTGKIQIEGDPLPVLGLSRQILPKIPDAVAGKGPASGKAAAKRSEEACLLRGRLREATSNLGSIALQLCHFESQKGLAAGKKYKVKLAPSGPLALQGEPPGPGNDPTGGGTPPSGPGNDPAPPTDSSPATEPAPEVTMSLFLDDSIEKQLTVYICTDDKLSQKFVVIPGTEGQGAKGSYTIDQSMTGSWRIQIQGVFDNGFTEAGRFLGADQAAFDITTGQQTQKMRSNSSIDLVEGGLSTIKVASESTLSGDFTLSYRELMAAAISPEQGALLLQRNGASKSTVAKVETFRSYFDAAGKVLTKEDSPDFAEGGKLALADDTLPKLPPDSFAASFGAGDWDCSGTEEFTVEKGDAFQACAEQFVPAFSEEHCSDAVYAPGSSVDVPSAVDERQQGAPELPPSDAPPPPTE